MGFGGSWELASIYGGTGAGEFIIYARASSLAYGASLISK